MESSHVIILLILLGCLATLHTSVHVPVLYSGFGVRPVH